MSVQILQHEGATITKLLAIAGFAIANCLLGPGGKRDVFIFVFFVFSSGGGVPLKRSGPPPAPPEAAESNFEWILVVPGHHVGSRWGTLGTLWRHRCGPGVVLKEIYS